MICGPVCSWVGSTQPGNRCVPHNTCGWPYQQVGTLRTVARYIDSKRWVMLLYLSSWVRTCWTRFVTHEQFWDTTSRCNCLVIEPEGTIWLISTPNFYAILSQCRPLCMHGLSNQRFCLMASRCDFIIVFLRRHFHTQAYAIFKRFVSMEVHLSNQ